MFDEFRNPGDGRREHKLFVRHSLHQNHRDSFALAGQHNEIGLAVISEQMNRGQVTDQVNAILKA